MRKIAVLTSGGDAPGMNNAIRGVIKAAKMRGLEIYVVLEGYKGLYNNQIYPSDNYEVDKYLNQGGTFIYSARFPEFKNPEVRQKAKENLLSKGIEALVVIGGDGSYKGAQLLNELGVKTIGLPGTIDNDIASSDYTIGYDTALNTIVQAIDRIRETASSHKRIMIVEVMGNGCGDLALYSGLATEPEIILTNQYKLSHQEIIEKIKPLTEQKNRRSIILVVSEKCYDIKALESEIQNATKWDTRSNQLNHIQRGGTPTAQERILSTLLGMKSVELILQGQSGLALGIINNDIKSTPILEALSMENTSKNKATQRAEKFNKLNQA